MKSLYSKLGILYQQEYSGPYRDLTTETEKSLLVISRKDGVLSGFGRPAVCFGDTRDGLRSFKKLYEHCKNVWYMDLSGGVDKISQFLIENGHEPNLFFTQIIDLARSLPDIHADMRKSYQNLANKYEPIITSYPGVTNTFKELHKAVCGRQTRNDATWEIQGRMMAFNEAFVVHSPSWDAAGMFIYNQDSCYYGVGKSLDGAVSHPIIWKAIYYAQKIGCREFELGEQIFTGDQKVINISSFKRGFGGETKIRLEFKGVL